LRNWIAVKTQPTQIREKAHRLAPDNYQGRVSVFFTAIIHDRNPVFTDGSIFPEFERMLLASVKRHFCSLPIYLFMPDHLHVIIDGELDHSNTLQAMKAFKQQSGFWFSKNMRDTRWQKDFYDRILRNDESLENIVEYILHNPVRAGIAFDWKKYPFKGQRFTTFPIGTREAIGSQPEGCAYIR
jgi:putative transposase